MTFEFLKWRSSFKPYRRGVRKGDIAFERPRPWLDLKTWTGWGMFFFFGLGGSLVAGVGGIIAYFLAATVAGGFVFTVETWVYLFMGGWILFWILHLVHSIRFYRSAKLTNVEFVPLDKAKAIGKRVLTMPEDLTVADYNILYSRYIWADVEGEPYRDVTDWVERISGVQRGGETVSVRGIGEGIGYAIGSKYAESRLKEIIDTAGGIPSPQEIVKILQTELVPEYRKLLGEELMQLYLVFLGTQPPVLPYDKDTSRSEMRAVANAKNTEEVLDYLNKFVGD